MSYVEGAICGMCGHQVGHDPRGRVACEPCGLPTDCCPCPEQPALSAPRAIGAGPPPALAAGTAAPRLAERILMSGCRPAPFAEPGTAIPSSALRRSNVVLADGASIYTAALRELGQEVRLGSLPNLLPRYERCFLELRAGGRGGVSGWGAYLATLDLEAPGVLDRLRADSSLRRWAEAPARGGRWLVLSGLAVAGREGVPIGPVLVHQLCLDHSGRLAGEGQDERPAMATVMPRVRAGAAGFDQERFKEKFTRRYFLPVLVALAFSNCDNSRLEPAAVGHPALAATFERLRVEPFEQMVARLAKPGMTAVEAARRIVPGRFVDRRRNVHGRDRGGIRWQPEVVSHPLTG